MTRNSIFSLVIAVLCLGSYAQADPIEIVTLPEGEHPDELGVFKMFPFDQPVEDDHLCTESAYGNDVCFDDGDGNSVQLSTYASFGGSGTARRIRITAIYLWCLATII